MSTLKADAVTTKSDNTDLTLTGGGTGVPNLEAGFKIGGTAGVPVSELRAGTDGELITWDASGDAATVAVGTATHVLTSNGAGAAPTFQAAAAGGAWTLISSTTASDDADITITGISATYESYVAIVSDMKPATDDTRLYFRVGDSGGIDTSGYDYAVTGRTSDGPANFSSDETGATEIKISQNSGGTKAVGNGTGECINSTIQIYPNLGSNQYPTMTCYSIWMDNNTKPGFCHTGGSRQSDITMDRFQIFFQSGNITSGRVTLWGIKHT